MKTSSLNITLCVLAISALASCSGLEENVGQETGIGEYSISLSVFCQAPGTKAGRNDEDHNENKLDYVDWFVFKSDQDTDDALVSGRETPTGSNNNIKTVSLDQWVPTIGRDYYVYAVANYPTSLVADHDAMPKTLAGLKALPHTAVFNHQDKFSVEGEQANFIMRGGIDVSFSDSDRKIAKPVEVPLQRLAGKVSVKLNVAPAIDERNTLPDGSMQYVQTWYPDVENIEVYLSFANSSTTLEGTPVEYNMTDFFTYYRSGFEASFDPDITSDPTAHPNWDNGQWVISGSPFYSYPMEWDSESPQAPFLKVILKWKAYDESQGGTVNPETAPSEDGPKFVRHQRYGYSVTDLSDTNLKTDPADLPEFYYKIPLVPMSQDHGELEDNDWFIINADLSILGSTSDDLPVILGGQYYVTDWGVGMSSTGELKQASYLSLDHYDYEVYAENEITIPVHSSHDLESYTVSSVTYKDYSTMTPTVKDLPSSAYSITFDANQSLKLSHVLNKDFTSSELECSRITYVFTVTNKAGITSPPITVVQYPPLYIENETSDVNSNVFINGYTNNFNSSTDKDRFDNYYSYFSNKVHPIYDDGDDRHTFSPSFTSSNSYTDGNVSIEFDVNGSSVNKNMNANAAGENDKGNIHITCNAPYWIYRVELSYSSTRSYTASDITTEADIRSVTVLSPRDRWYGEARDLKMTYKSYASNPYTVSGITVYYHNANYMGTIAQKTENPNAPQNSNMYIISVTDVSQMNFFIADTRSSTPVDYDNATYGYLKQGGTGAVSTPLSNYYPLNLNVFNDNAIAPKFIVASTRGGSYGGAMRFESARERCASYQENGYPAGRWRLPTYAEIQFIVNLSAKGKIPTLFSGRFWSSKGRDGIVIRVNPPGTHTDPNTPADATELYEETFNTASIRCIYPLWYWGEEKMYDPAPNNTRPLTTWSGWQNN